MKKILIVDDDELTLQLYDLLLEEMEDVSYQMAESGTVSLDYLDQWQEAQWPDLLFIDLHMPDMSGFEFIEKYQERFGMGKKATQLFILSSSISHRDQDKAAKYPVIKGFLSKPLTEEILSELLLGRSPIITKK